MIQPETIADVKLKLEKHEQLTRQIETEMMRLQSYEQQFDDIVQAFENIERELNTVEQSLLTIGRSYHLPDSMANNHLLACFDLLVTLREKLLKKQLKEQQQKIAEQLKGKQARLKELAQIIKLPGTAYDEQVIYLKQYLETQKILSKQKGIHERIDTPNKSNSSLAKEQQGLQERIAQLFQQANVSTKEEFVRNGKNLRKFKPCINN